MSEESIKRPSTVDSSFDPEKMYKYDQEIIKFTSS